MNKTINFWLDKKDVKLSTDYYSNHKHIMFIYNKLIFKTYRNAEYKELLKELKNQADRLKIASTYGFFKQHMSNYIPEGVRVNIDVSIGLNPYTNTDRVIDINRFNFERLVASTKIDIINMSGITNQAPYSGDINDLSDRRFVAVLNDNTKFSDIAFAKHKNSIEFYNFRQNRSIAFKNYASGKTYGEWSTEIEDLAMQIVNKCIDFQKIKDRLDKIRNRLKSTTYNIIVDEVNQLCGIYMAPYKVTLIEETARQVLLIDDIPDKRWVKGRLDQAVKKLCNKDSKFNSAYELDMEEKRLRLRNLQDARANKYNQIWGKCEEAHYKLASGLDIKLPLPDVNSQTMHRIIDINVNLGADRLIGVQSDKSNIIPYEKLIKFTKNRIYNNREINIDTIYQLIRNGDVIGLENYLYSLLNDSFIKLVNTKEIEIHTNNNLIIAYEEATGKKYNPKLASGKAAEFKRAPGTERDYCIVFGGKEIYGGPNKSKQLGAHIKLTDEAIIDLFKLVGKPNPLSTEVNEYIEKNIWEAKTCRPDWCYLNEMAIETYTVNRDAAYFTKIHNLYPNVKKAVVYIPSGYRGWMETIRSNSSNNKLLKQSVTAISNILIYEHLMEVYGKDYRIYK